MKNLESFKKSLFVKELTNNEIKSVKGGFAELPEGGTGTHCTSTYSGGKYVGQDCSDTSNPDGN
jgi:hypothetical protein